jgi:hypothetical protein
MNTEKMAEQLESLYMSGDCPFEAAAWRNEWVEQIDPVLVL